MIAKFINNKIRDTKELKKEAIELRRKGLSYSEILTKLSVAKSTLALWLKEVGLSKAQKTALTQKRLDASRRGGLAKKNQRIKRTVEVFEKAKNSVHKITDKDLLLIGAMLYWAEGAKQKEHNVSQKIAFSNSDEKMLKLFLLWLKKIANVSEGRIFLELYIHKSANRFEAIKFWERVLNKKVNKVYFKKGNFSTRRRNFGEVYHGLIRVIVLKSTDLNRYISGLVQGVLENCG